MTLTETAQRMLGTLPAYYRGESQFERIIQAWANEVDRREQIIDELEVELQPGAATDKYGLLGIWEAHFELPVRPPGATLTQRQGKVDAALRKLDSAAAADALAVLDAAVGEGTYLVYRDTPDPLKDTLAMTFYPGTYNAVLLESIALELWPSHRELLIHFEDGFVLDIGRLDSDTLS